MENKRRGIAQFLKKYWVLVVFIVAYLVGDMYGFSGIESSLFSVAVFSLIMFQREENKREKLENRIEEISRKLAQ